MLPAIKPNIVIQMKVVKKIWPFIFLLVVYISGTINSIVHGILENKIVYNFQITKIEHTPTNQLIFYDGENEIEFQIKWQDA